MKAICFLTLLGTSFLSSAQPTLKTKNIIIITTDGFRWQEVFTGADSLLINNEKYTADTSFTKQMYWDETPENRRKKLLPFFWNIIASKGQLYGNRFFNNRVNMKNPYKISYPGYNEILTGYADLFVTKNRPVKNKNRNILEYLNAQPDYKGKVAAFTSWDIFPFIINEDRSKFQVNSGYEMLADDSTIINHKINQVQEIVNEKTGTRHDLLTYISAREYLQAHHPRVLFLGFGETDEEAHKGNYGAYLQKAAMADKMIGDLFLYIQSDSFYKDNTTIIITTDHGRGNTAGTWNTHSTFINGSGETWLAIIGPDIIPAGEMKEEQQSYGNQLAATIALLLGEKFDYSLHTGKPIPLPANGKDKSVTGNSLR